MLEPASTIEAVQRLVPADRHTARSRAESAHRRTFHRALRLVTSPAPVGTERQVLADPEVRAALMR
jgi:hypothetical protein